MEKKDLHIVHSANAEPWSFMVTVKKGTKIATYAEWCRNDQIINWIDDFQITKNNTDIIISRNHPLFVELKKRWFKITEEDI